MPNYLPRVQRGAELLDRRAPGWWAKVGHPSDLIMWHPSYNILARAFGTHAAGLAALGLDRPQAAHHGFTTYPEDPPVAFDALASDWCREAALRVPPPPSIRRGVA